MAAKKALGGEKKLLTRERLQYSPYRHLTRGRRREVFLKAETKLPTGSRHAFAP